MQRSIVDAAVRLLRPGGVLVYSVCTLTDAEGPGIGAHLLAGDRFQVLEAPAEGPWETRGHVGHLILPQTSDTDGMYLLRLRLSREDGRITGQRSGKAPAGLNIEGMPHEPSPPQS